MNGRKAKLMRIAAGHPKTPAEYEKPEIQRVMGLPQFEMHTRTVKMWNPKARPTFLERAGAMIRGEVPRHLGDYETRQITKIRMRPDGKTPYRMLTVLKTNAGGTAEYEPQVELIPISKPRRLKTGSPRRVYQMLKRLDRASGGLDNVFTKLLKEQQHVEA